MMKKFFFTFIYLLIFFLISWGRIHIADAQEKKCPVGYDCVSKVDLNINQNYSCEKPVLPEQVECGKEQNYLGNKFYPGICCLKMEKISGGKPCPSDYQCFGTCPRGYVRNPDENYQTCGEYKTEKIGDITTSYWTGECCKKDISNQSPQKISESDSCGGENQECCRLKPESMVQIDTENSIPQQENDCVINIKALRFRLICMSDTIKSVENTLNEQILNDEEFKQISAMGYCDEGFFPSYLDLNGPSNDINDLNKKCICKSQLSMVSDQYLCNHYYGDRIEKINDKDEKGKKEKEKLLKELASCINCVNKKGYYSGLGCIYFKDWQQFFVKNVFGVIFGFAGVFAFFCIIYAAIQLQLSEGNPEKIKKAQELLTSCIMGLVLIVFSVFLLRLITIDILKIPGFGR